MRGTEEIVRALAGPLEVEMREGYRDTAVIGHSLGEYVRAWAERARTALTDPGEEAVVSRVEATLAAYQSADGRARRASVDEAQQLLTELAEALRPARPRARAPARATHSRRGAAHSRARSPSNRRSGTRAAGGAPPATEPADESHPTTSYLDAPLAQGRYRSLAWIQRLRKLGIETRRDLLYHVPRDYVLVKRIADLADGERAAVVAEAGARDQAVTREGRSFRLMRYALEIQDGSGKAWVTSFARVPRHGRRSKAILASPLALNYAEGTRLLVEGAVRRAGPHIEIQHSGSQKLLPAEDVAPGTLVPVYPLTDGVYQGQLRPALRRILDEMPGDIPDPLPESLLQRQRLLGLPEALRAIHWPASTEAKEKAQRRLVFEELLTLQLALAQRKAAMQRPGSGISMEPRGDMVAMLEEVLPFSLTRAQQRVIAEVAADMAADQPMSRMVQGDVGSGKTVVAAAALLIALQSGYQGALMAPTELLAEQHYLVLSRMLGALGVRLELLTGSLRGRDKQKAGVRIAGGQAQVVVGTHALIQEGVEFDSLGLVIVDEQHRFGVRQRAELLTKGRQPDMLVMTATPIPRTLAMTLYGDLDISILDEMPPGRRPVLTRWMPLQSLTEAYEFVGAQSAEGRQAYIVCPLVEESEKLQAEAATTLAQELGRDVFPDLDVGLLHGAMPVAEKDAVMESFRAGEKSVLCATTVIEVGVDVPNATVMLVLNAERFGLAQLHQLRGRVGRGGQESHCILVSDRKYNPSPRLMPAGDESLGQARSRLRVLLDTSDGFAIAEQDLLLRGPGEFYGTRQHGVPELRFARMARDVRTLEEARAAAFRLIEQQPDLAGPDHAALREQVAQLRARMERAVG